MRGLQNDSKHFSKTPKKDHVLVLGNSKKNNNDHSRFILPIFSQEEVQLESLQSDLLAASNEVGLFWQPTKISLHDAI